MDAGAGGGRTPDEARRLAERTCRGCGWYHGFWPLLRALGFGTSPDDHAEFYETAIAEALDAGPIRNVLVCGTADATMPRLTAAILRRAGAGGACMTLLDRCGTPLILASEALAAAGVAHRVIQADALEAELPEGGFDLVVTHSFFGYFTPRERTRLLERWSAALRPGGRALAINRLRVTDRLRIGFSETEAEAFVRKIVLKLAESPGLTDLKETELLGRARDYAARFRIHPLTSLESFAEQSRTAGLSPAILPLGTVARTGPVGPTAPGGALYHGFVLTR